MQFSNACIRAIRERERAAAKHKHDTELHNGAKRACHFTLSERPANRSSDIDALTQQMEYFQLKTGAQTYTSQLLSQMRTSYRQRYEDWVAAKRIDTRLHISTNPLRDAANNEGDTRLKKLRRMLDCFGVVRSQDQRLFHRWYELACMPNIYGAAAWNANYTRIMREHNCKKLRQEVLVLAPRRFGKTYAIAMFVAAMLLCVPGIEIAIFSTGKRASSKLTDLIKTMFTHIPGATDRIVKESTEHLYIAMAPLPSGQTKRGDMANKLQVSQYTSKLFSLPGGSAGKLSYIHSYSTCVCVCRTNGRIYLVVW